MADIFQEVDEALRQDRAKEWWQRYGNMVIGAAVVLILAVAGWNGWNRYQTSERSKASIVFTGAVDGAAKDRTAAITALEKLPSGVEPYASLARLKIAQLKAEAGDHAAAAAAYASAAPSANASDLKDLSILMGVMQAFDTASPDELQAKLQPLAAQGQPWRPSALEMMAVVAMKRNDMAAARTLWAELRDDTTTPPGLRERAREMAAILGGDGSKKN